MYDSEVILIVDLLYTACTSSAYWSLNYQRIIDHSEQIINTMTYNSHFSICVCMKILNHFLHYNLNVSHSIVNVDVCIAA